ncbi:hypothetical protein [Reyranella sp. CPCC 100927]|uniref:hypothetical protein n=1 Tax=Reyranella sp. CPCC 100927 TaxID=2599616 RepID=UPI0011B4BA07|nr:hypothetical protein [Reyranella sp. CPCC 100927]TWS98300.1 hypothetical protein FQU96_36360 [Reyranella sp. CPCC 100927]
MPITHTDVIDVLQDPLVKRMNFRVGRVSLSAAEYGKVVDHLQTGDITVAPARNGALYRPGPNTIELAGDSPLDVRVRRDIIHECTHALIDINAPGTTRLEGEVAAYLAEFTYLLMWNNTRPFVGDRSQEMANTPDSKRTLQSISQFAYTYNLHVPQGFGTSIDLRDIARMVTIVQAEPLYAGIGRNEKLISPGVRIHPPWAPAPHKAP